MRPGQRLLQVRPGLPEAASSLTPSSIGCHDAQGPRYPVIMNSAHPRERIWGGWAFIVGGFLLYGAQLTVLLLPPPPPEPADVAPWVLEHTTQLAISNELLFFAVVCLMPAVIVLYRQLESKRAFSALIGCTSMMMGLVILSTLVLVGGRLVYPVFGIALSADIIALLVSLFFGGLHSVLLLFGLALIVLASALGQSASGRWMQTATYGAGGLQILGSYPWLTPSWWNVTAATALVTWTFVVGVVLVSTGSRESSSPVGPRRRAPS